MASVSHQLINSRSWLWLAFTVLLFVAGHNVHAAPVPIYQLREVFANATAAELEQFPPEVLDMVFHHDPPNINGIKMGMEEYTTKTPPNGLESNMMDNHEDDNNTADRSLLFGWNNDDNNDKTETGHHAGRTTLSFHKCFIRELNAMSNQFDAVEYKRMVLAEAGIDDEKLLWREIIQENQRSATKFRQTHMAQAILTTIHQHHDEFYEIYNIYTSCQQEAAGNNNSSAEGSGIHAGKSFLNAMNRNPNVRRRLQASPSASPSLSIAPSAAPSRAPSSSPTSNGILNIGFHVEVGLLADFSFSLFNGDESGSSPACFSTKDWQRNCVGIEAGAGAEFSLILLIDLQTVAPNGQSCWFDVDAGAGPHAGFATGNYVTGQGSMVEVTIGSGAGIGMGGAWCWDA